MNLQKTDKTILNSEDILKYIQDYETYSLPHLNLLWEYYKGKNVKILNRKPVDPNNPDNRIIVSYGRKLITTWTGYGYRPKFITYKANIKKSKEEIEKDEFIANGQIIEKTVEDPIEKKYVNELQNVYNTNNEHIKTSRAGRNTGIFGFSYEVLYVDSEIKPQSDIPIKAVPKFFTVDPREMILLYDFAPEPNIKIGIRFYKIDDNNYKVEVYYSDRVEFYVRYRDNQNTKWLLKQDPDKATANNLFYGVPIVAFYLGDEMQSIIEPILTLIDAYDVLLSDSMNEFDRFAFAYLIMKRFGLSNPVDKKDPTKSNENIKNIKRRRVFEHLPADADIKFLTKDIPYNFIDWMAKELKEKIHTQSHIPNFAQLTGALSGAAIDRLLFDFENLVSSAEADFDVALIRRGELITEFLKNLGRVPKESDMSTMVSINHKRNTPLNKREYADTALVLQNGGFSRRMIVSQMPEDMVPDIEEELKEEKLEQESMVGEDFENTDMTEYDEEGNAITDEFGNPLETNKVEGE